MEKNTSLLLKALKNLQQQQKDIWNIMSNDELNKLTGSEKYYDTSPSNIPEVFKKKMTTNHKLLPISDSIAKSYTQVLDVMLSLKNHSKDSTKEKEGKELEKIKIAKEKEFITTKEFELLYSYGIESQKCLRGRIQNHIPFIQKSAGSKILYNKENVEKWLKSK